jgi:hypothetical protein
MKTPAEIVGKDNALCKNCHCWLPGRNPYAGLCIRRAPLIAVTRRSMPSGESNDVHTRWPETRAFDGCFDFLPKPGFDPNGTENPP